MKLLRLYSDDNGESHFEDVEIPFEAVDTFDNTDPVLFSQFEPADTYGFERIPPGWVGDWHPAPTRVLAVYLSGNSRSKRPTVKCDRSDLARYSLPRTPMARAIGIESRPD